MKLKYYMRGLGIGILVTALIMGLSLQGKRELSDDEIKERAAKLGMVEESAVLLPSTKEVTPAPEQKETPKEASKTEVQPEDEAEQAMETETDNQSDVTEKLETSDQSKSNTDQSDAIIRESEDAVGVAGGSNKINADNKNSSQLGAVTITVESGNGSDVVSRKLVEAGLVDNAETFDKYLCNHNYDYKITIGKHTIPGGSTYDEIARILISVAE